MDRLEQIYLELARRRLREHLRYFQPHGGQEEFLALLATPGAYSVTAGAGNGWGKTEIIVAALAAIVWPAMAPQAFTKHALFANWPYPKRVRINSTPAELQEIGALQVAIKNLFPKGRYQAKRKQRPYDSEWRSDTGWVIDTFSYEQDVDEMAGPTLGLQIWNEPMPEALWREGQARLRRGGMNWCALTSLTKNPWVVDGLLNKHDGVKFITRYGSSCENCRQHGKNGHLEHDQIEMILSQFPADEREARFTGKPLSLSGRIFKNFSPEVHVLRSEMKLPDECSVYQVVDPAIGKPLAVIYAYVDRTGQVVIFDEHPRTTFDGAPDDNLTVPDYAAIFQRLEMEHGRSTDVRILDRHFGNARRTLGGPTLFEEFASAGLSFQDSYTMPDDAEVETGIRKVKDYLAYNREKPVDALNRPRLLVHERCRNTIAAISGWSRNPKTLWPLEQFKDFADCVRYLVMDEPQVQVRRVWKAPTQVRYA